MHTHRQTLREKQPTANAQTDSLEAPAEQRHTDRPNKSHTNRLTDELTKRFVCKLNAKVADIRRQADSQADLPMRQCENSLPHIDRQTNIHTHSHTHSQTDLQTDAEIIRRTQTRPCRWTYRQTRGLRPSNRKELETKVYPDATEKQKTLENHVYQDATKSSTRLQKVCFSLNISARKQVPGTERANACRQCFKGD